METINPQSVLEAYRSLDIKPICKRWATTLEDGTKCGCALTALATAEGVAFSDILAADEDEYSYEFIAEKLGLSGDYISGFVYGYDKHPVISLTYNSDRRALREKGYADGKATRELIDQHFEVVTIKDPYEDVEEDEE